MTAPQPHDAQTLGDYAASLAPEGIDPALWLKLMNLYLNGFTTGVTSGLINYPKYPAQKAHECADHAGDMMVTRQGLQAVAKEVTEMMAGIDTTDKSAIIITTGDPR